MKSVECGAAFLDEHCPGWEDSINLDTLDLSDAPRCILGQIYLREHPRVKKTYEAYARKAVELGIRWPGYADQALAGRLGFMTYGRGTFANLTKAWKKLILARRASV